MAFAIQNSDKENFQFNDGLGVDTLNLNPRILGVYFGETNGRFVKNVQSDEFILIQDSPTMDEPFDGLTILENGVLQIDFRFWYSAGSWYMSNHQYKFRFQNSGFELIGYESSERNRATGATTDYSINFSSKKMRITKINFDEETGEEPIDEKWKKFELKNLKSIQSLRKPFDWEFEGIYL